MTCRFYQRYGFGHVVADLRKCDPFSHNFSKFSVTPSPVYSSFRWSHSNFVARLSSRQYDKRGNLKYAVPKSTRAQTQVLLESYRRVSGRDYDRKYMPTQPNMLAGYRNKNRYCRQPFPEQDLSPEIAKLFPVAMERVGKRFAPFLSGSETLSMQEVISQADMTKSNGAVWRDVFRTKREFFESKFIPFGPSKGLPWNPIDVLENFYQSLSAENTAFYVFWLDKLKDEIRPIDKLRCLECVDKEDPCPECPNKIRTFNCASTEMVIAMNQLCLDCNQSFYVMGANGVSWSTVGSSKYMLGWDRDIRKHLKVGPKNSYGLDGGQWDSRMFYMLLWAVCLLRQQWTVLTEDEKCKLRNLYRILITRMVQGEAGDILMFFLGNPSGSSNTICDNTIGFSILWEWVWLVLLRVENLRRRKTGEPLLSDSQTLMDKHVCLSICGDDVRLTISDDVLPWFNLHAIITTMASWNTLIEYESLQPMAAPDVVYTSNKSELVNGFYLPSPNYDRVVACLIEASEKVPYKNFDVDPRWALLRLYAVRIDSWGNSELRALISDMILDCQKSNRQLFVSTHPDENIHKGVTWRAIQEVYKTDRELEWLYFGFEEGGPAGKEIFPFIFCPQDSEQNSIIYSIMREFDSTLGYPGEGPGIWDTVTAAPAKLRFKYHGNWGGPNYGGGKHLSFGEIPDWNVPPIDELDATFRRHDYNYTRMPQNKADKIWVQEAKRLPPSLKAQLAMLGFHLKSIDAGSITPGWTYPHVEEPTDYPWEIRPKEKAERIGEASNPGPPKGGKQKRGKKSKKPQGKKVYMVAAKPRVQVPKKKMKAMVAKVSKMVKAPVTSLVRAPQKGFKLYRGTRGSVIMEGQIVLVDMNNLAADLPAYTSIFNSKTVNNNATNAGNPPFIALNPYALMAIAGNWGGETDVAAMADFYEHWTGEFHMEFKSGTTTGIGGMWTAWFDKDSADRDYIAGDPSIVQEAELHGGKQTPIYESFSMSFKTKKRMWLRSASQTDIRTVNLANFYVIANQKLYALDAATHTIPYGELICRYKIKFSTRTSKEINYASQYTNDVDSFAGANGFPIGATNTKASNPLSQTVVPYVSDSMAAGPASILPATLLVLNHKFTTPKAAFVQVHLAANATSTFTFGCSYFIGGTNVTTSYSMNDVQATSTAFFGISVWTFFIPAGTPADFAQVQFYTVAAATVTDFNMWTLESCLFAGDFGSTVSTYSKRFFKPTLTPSEDIEQRISRLIRQQLDEKEDKKDDALALGPTPLCVIQDSPVIVGKSLPSDLFDALERPKSKAKRFGEAENPGPWVAQKGFDEWLTDAMSADVTVRATRTSLAEGAKKVILRVRNGNGGFVITNTEYERIVSFLISSRNPVSNDAKLSFTKALSALADRHDKFLDNGDEKKDGGPDGPIGAERNAEHAD